jgi:hypothetical protein
MNVQLHVHLRYIVPVPGVTTVTGFPVMSVHGGDVRTNRYRITIAGSLGQTGREAFADFGIAANGRDTVLTGTLDQAALYGALTRILSLGLELVELSRLADGTS